MSRTFSFFFWFCFLGWWWPLQPILSGNHPISDKSHPLSTCHQPKPRPQTGPSRRTSRPTNPNMFAATCLALLPTHLRRLKPQTMCLTTTGATTFPVAQTLRWSVGRATDSRGRWCRLLMPLKCTRHVTGLYHRHRRPTRNMHKGVMYTRTPSNKNKRACVHIYIYI